MRPDAAWPGRVFEWTNRYNYGGKTIYVVLNRWTPNPHPKLKVLVLDTSYPFHNVAEVMELRPADDLWVTSVRIA